MRNIYPWQLERVQNFLKTIGVFSVFGVWNSSFRLRLDTICATVFGVWNSSIRLVEFEVQTIVLSRFSDKSKLGKSSKLQVWGMCSLCDFMESWPFFQILRFVENFFLFVNYKEMYKHFQFIQNHEGKYVPT